MPVLRVPTPVDPDRIALEVDAVEDTGATVHQVVPVGDEWWIVHTPAPARRPSTKAKQTRSAS